MDDLHRQKRRRDNDGPVLPPYPTPICECGKPAGVTQSLHLDTAARSYYMCGSDHHWEYCNFFQWIDGPDMVDQRIIHFRPKVAKSYALFQHWIPPPPNPPPMSPEEKKEAIARRMANPPLRHCGDPAKISRMMPDSPYTPTFKCSNRTIHGYPVCVFKEYDYGPIPCWSDEETMKKAKPKERYIKPDTQCECGVKANWGLVPSELGIGYYCGQMVGEDLSTRGCSFESYIEKENVDHEIVWRSKRGIHRQVLRSYVKLRKGETREEAQKRGLWPRRSGLKENKTSEMEFRRFNGESSGQHNNLIRRSTDDILRGLDQRNEKEEFENKKRLRANGEIGERSEETVSEFQKDVMRSLIANLPKEVPHKE